MKIGDRTDSLRILKNKIKINSFLGSGNTMPLLLIKWDILSRGATGENQGNSGPHIDFTEVINLNT